MKRMVQVSQRLSAVPASPIRKLVPFAMQAKKRGIKVYHLNIGDPDIKTPDVMLSALRTLRINPIGYSQSKGEPVFIEALRTYYHKLGFRYIEADHIQVTSGGSEAITMAMFAVANPGDEILVFEPFYTNYNSYAAINGITLVPVATDIVKGFHLPSRKEIEEKITNKTGAILYCNPNNPTGTVYTKEEIEMLVKLAKKHNLFLLSDEVYREYAYDGRSQVSLFDYMQQIPDKAIVLDSLSKRYSVCGVRLGALVCLNKDIIAGTLRMAQGRLSSGLIDQLISSKLTEVPDSYLQLVRKEYQKRRDVLYQGLKNIPGVTITKPEGAFYVIVGLPVNDSDDFCRFLLTDFSDNNETVMVAPASGFYATQGRGKNEVRIAYVLNTTDLTRAVVLLSRALSAYNKK